MNQQNQFWWQIDDETEMGNLLTGLIEQLKDNHRPRHNNNLDMLRMYTGRDNDNLGRYGNTGRIGNIGDEKRMRLNVVGNITDTLVSRLGKAKPKPMYLTRRGDYRLRQNAKRLSDVMEGIFYQTGIYDVMPKVFQDSCIFDMACMKIGREGKELFVERVFPNELLWDLNAAMYTDIPPSLHQVKMIPLETLVLQYPEREEDIRYQASSNRPDFLDEQGHEADMVECVESWHLPSTNDSIDGRHTISCNSLILTDEQHNYGNYPFVFMKWGDACVGFAGIALAEQLKAIQLEINKLSLRIQQAMHLLSVPWLFVQHGSRVVESRLRNVPGTIVNYVGQPPTSYNPTAMHPEVYSHLDRLYQKAYEIAGVSELSATGKKPAGLESGAALRTYHDIETERFISVGQRYEKAFMDAASWFFDLAREIVQESGSFPVRGIKGHSLQEIDFKDVKMAENDYILQAYPVSLLPSTPAGRLQAVTELIQNGVITQREHIVRLLDFPDLESVTSLYDVLERDIEWRIQEIVDEGIYHGPEPAMDLAFAKERMTVAYLEAQQDDLDLDKIALMLQFIEACDELMQPITPEGSAPAGGALPLPGGTEGLGETLSPGPPGLPMPEGMMAEPGMAGPPAALPETLPI
tara:strand:+ start:2122 stop:4026 length:1905 start_codon:yes stop_codon:yes gene_type:complete